MKCSLLTLDRHRKVVSAESRKPIFRPSQVAKLLGWTDQGWVASCCEAMKASSIAKFLVVNLATTP